MRDQLEVSLNVPDLGRAERFYTTVLDVPPAASVRRAAWFDVPETELRLAVREASTPGAADLRICVDPAWLRAASTRLRSNRVRIAARGLATDGHPRAIAFSDPGGNRLELCAPLKRERIVSTPPIDRRRRLRSFARVLHRSLGPDPIGERLDRARAQEQLMPYPNPVRSTL